MVWDLFWFVGQTASAGDGSEHEQRPSTQHSEGESVAKSHLGLDRCCKSFMAHAAPSDAKQDNDFILFAPFFSIYLPNVHPCSARQGTTKPKNEGLGRVCHARSGESNSDRQTTSARGQAYKAARRLQKNERRWRRVTPPRREAAVCVSYMDSVECIQPSKSDVSERGQHLPDQARRHRMSPARRRQRWRCRVVR